MLLRRTLNPIFCGKLLSSTFNDIFRCVSPPMWASSKVAYRPIQTTMVNWDLMEFFDDKKNWGAERVYVGRSWRKEELRIKSNSDLHKLWYVLLKERNMLFTMQHESNEKTRIFPNPERIDKVMESMYNLEDVVRERNQAYFKLETGETGERPAKVVYNQLGLKFFYKMFEHIIPKFMNKKWNEEHKFYYNYDETKNFLQLYREKLYRAKRRTINRERRHLEQLFIRFPNIDVEYLKETYPHLDIDEIKASSRAVGHRS